MEGVNPAKGKVQPIAAGDYVRKGSISLRKIPERDFIMQKLDSLRELLQALGAFKNFPERSNYVFSLDFFLRENFVKV
jgi:hypothetical protein